MSPPAIEDRSELFPEAFFGDDFNFTHELYVLVTNHPHHVLDQPVMKRTGHITGVDHTVKGQKEDGAWRGRQKTDPRIHVTSAREGFSK